MESSQRAQRVVIGMIDGFGTDYLEASDMPVLRSMIASGLHRTVSAVMPTVTNVNNVSICCGAWPDEHGITGNSYFDERTSQPEYMERAEDILVPTILERARRAGVRSALLTCKKKTIHLLARGADVAIAAESPPSALVDRYGLPGDIYSAEINLWLWRVAIDLLRERPDIGLLYVHTTDYPMHMWAPSAPESLQHLAKLDALLGEASAAAPDAAFYLTADHGMSYKRQCYDLSKAVAERGRPLRYSLSAERDRYIKHHRTFGGTAWVWLENPSDAADVTEILRGLPGVEAVLSRAEAAARFRLLPERIGELVVLGDRSTVFGELPGPREELEPTYRSHGSLHEAEVPLVVFNADHPIPPPERFRANVDLVRHLFR